MIIKKESDVKPEYKPIRRIRRELIENYQGPAFNKKLNEAPLNSSTSKQSFAFSKAKRFSNVSVNSQGYAISMLGVE